VSSAVATKIAIDRIDRIFYTHIDDHHEDTMRFVRDCEQWFGKKIDIVQSEFLSVEAACLHAGGKGYINGPTGAACTRILKRDLRKKIEYDFPVGEKVTYVWGFDNTESDRADRVCDHMIDFGHIFPLIDRGISKKHAHEILRASGIKRPAMYDLGYNNNNCIGCVKGGMGYWNHIRRDFPDVFQARSRLERTIGHSCIKGCFLDELDENTGIESKPIVDDCGILCGIMSIK